jgi:hypothetical protein
MQISQCDLILGCTLLINNSFKYLKKIQLNPDGSIRNAKWNTGRNNAAHLIAFCKSRFLSRSLFTMLLVNCVRKENSRVRKMLSVCAQGLRQGQFEWGRAQKNGAVAAAVAVEWQTQFMPGGAAGKNSAKMTPHSPSQQQIIIFAEDKFSRRCLQITFPAPINLGNTSHTRKKHHTTGRGRGESKKDDRTRAPWREQ